MSDDDSQAAAARGPRRGAVPAQGVPSPPESAALKPGVCPACGFVSPLAFRFCGGCGASLAPRAQAASLPGATQRPAPERRQLTVLFCDLVGSTSLSSRMDPEEMRDLMRAYQAACTAVIRRFDGTVSRYVGDGILALFGYPRAHEDDPERAVRAGLAIVASMAHIPAAGGVTGAEPLAVRIGIATGLVVVGDLIGEGAAEEEAVVGETPNLAARMQSLATPNSVVISTGTHALVEARFDCEDLGAHSLRGFSSEVGAWRVLAPRIIRSRWAAAQGGRVSPLVNQKEHLGALRRLWGDAQQGSGRVALLGGDPGIGKSRVVQALRESLSGTPHAVLSYQCSPHYANTALHPMIEQMERAAGIAREDAPSGKLAKFSEWLGPGPETAEAVPLLGALLSIPPDARFPLPPMSPQLQKDRTLELIVWFTQRLAASRPLLVVFEDVHWADPTTQEYLELLIDRVRAMRALVVLTFRPDAPPPWPDQPHIERRELRNLPRHDALALAQQVAGERLPPSIVAQVVAKTDGVPLFVEELTRALIGAEVMSERGSNFMRDSSLPPLAIPATLQDSLMARLDQLGPEKGIAQIAGAIGREFGFELLEAVAGLAPAELRAGLLALERAGLVFAEPGPGPRYAFKHALVQEVAYHSLLRTRRRELHLRIAEALETLFPQTARDTPELVAHHWTEAGNVERALDAWLAAGRHAAERSEHREAIAHLRTGLALIPQVADPSLQRERELDLLLALGPALITTAGGGSQEARAAYTRALELCGEMPESASHFAACWGSWRVAMDLRAGSDWADRLVGLARTLRDASLLLQAHHCQWATLYMRGAHDECRRQIEAGLELYDPQRHPADASRYGGHDARVCALGELALATWMLGRPQAALAHAQAALAWAQELRQAGSRAHALDYSLVLHKFRRDAVAVASCSRELVAYASEQQLREHRAKGAFFQGWARAMLGDAGAGMAAMVEAMEAFRGVGTPEDISVYYEMLAEVCALEGRFEQGLSALSDAFAQTESCGILFWNAELHRRRGELLLAAGAQDAAAAVCFENALACARAQGARALELRAAISLARLHRGGAGYADAREVLRTLYASFEEGFDTPDLTDARQLLEASP